MTTKKYILLIASLLLSTAYVVANKQTLSTIELSVEKGKSYNYPTFALWLESAGGKFVQELYVTQSLATGIYNNADAGDKRWKREKGEARRPSTLPYFLHKRDIQAPDGTYLPTPEQPIPDAYTGATPRQSDVMTIVLDRQLYGKYRIVFEINQPWDFNRVWYNNRYPNNTDYLLSGQPSLVYMVEIDTNILQEEYTLNPIGHGHPYGKTGTLFTDISGITTAKNIFKSIKVKVY